MQLKHMLGLMATCKWCRHQ